MLLGEPPRTNFDFHFQVFGIPVRVHPFFWLVALILGARGTGQDLIVWVIALFFSILIHELGHSMMMHRFGIRSHIVLHMLGGLAIPDSFGMGQSRMDSRQWILICAAGPGAGFALAAAVVVLLLASGGQFQFTLQFPLFWQYRLGPALAENRATDVLIHYLLFINIFWGLVNLLPIYPLDGGQIARQVFTDRDPWNGMVRSLWLSLIASGVVAVAGVMVMNSLFVAIMFGMLGFQSYTMIRQLTGGGGFGGGGFGGRPW